MIFIHIHVLYWCPWRDSCFFSLQFFLHLTTSSFCFKLIPRLFYWHTLISHKRQRRPHYWSHSKKCSFSAPIKLILESSRVYSAQFWCTWSTAVTAMPLGTTCPFCCRCATRFAVSILAKLRNASTIITPLIIARDIAHGALIQAMSLNTPIE